MKSTGSKLLSRPSTSPSSLREDGNRSASSRTSVYSDFTDGPGSNFQSTVTECVFSVATKSHEAFVVELDDDGISRSRDGALPKPPLQKKSSDVSFSVFCRVHRRKRGVKKRRGKTDHGHQFLPRISMAHFAPFTQRGRISDTCMSGVTEAKRNLMIILINNKYHCL